MIINSEKTLKAALEFIHANELLAYDIETTGLNPRRDTIIGFGISNADQGYYLPTYKYEAASLHNLNVDNWAHQLFSALKTKKLLMFNASFDGRFTKYFYGVDLVPNLHADVLLLKHTCDEEFPFGLKEIAAKLWGADVKAEKAEMLESIKANGGTAKEYYKADLLTISKYCVQDCLLTFRIFNHYSPILKKECLEAFYYEQEVMPLYREVTIPMEEQGIQLDIPLLRRCRSEINLDISRLEHEIQDAIAPQLSLFRAWFLNKDYPPQTPTGKVPNWAKKGLTQDEAWARDNPNSYMFNLQSKHHLKKLFFETLNCKPLSRTPTGLPQVDEDFMDSVQSELPWVSKLIEYNKLQKTKSTYIERFLDEHESGIFYASFYQHRTVSGRFGSDVQQLPRPLGDSSLVSTYTDRIRQFIIPRNGRKLMSADYEQLEPSIFAHASTDPALQEIFRAGKDFYSEVAIRTERLKGVSSDKTSDNYLGKLDKSARQKAKAYALGIAYGMTGYKLQFELAVPQEDAERLVNDYLNAFPKLKEWMYGSQDYVKTHGYIRTQSGRVRHMPRAVSLFRKYGERLRDSLFLWSNYNQTPQLYEQVKADRKIYINLCNNAINFQIQGLAASVVNQAAIHINRALITHNLKSKLIMQIHDELVYEVLDSEKEVVAELVKSAMETMADKLRITVPLRTTPQFGDNYAQCK